MKIIKLILLLLVVAGTGYYFTPKTIVTCGSAIPREKGDCAEATCKRGFPMAHIGSTNITCLLGGEPTYAITY